MFCNQDCFKSAWAEHRKIHKTTWQYVTNRGRDRQTNEPSFLWTGDLRPERVGPYRKVPNGIPLPDYALDGIPHSEMQSRFQREIPVWSGNDLEGIRAACRLGREVLDKAHAAIYPGITTDAIDEVVHEATIKAGAYPSPLNYHSFPKSVCTSVNEVICHGIPDCRMLIDGDICNVDVTVNLTGFNGDLNETYIVGENVPPEAKNLIKVTYECLQRSIEIVKPGTRYRDVGDIISKHARAHGYSVVKSYCGHGIGKLFHCSPSIPHYAKNKATGFMRAGHVFTIEPMINEGVSQDVTWPDGWTAVTRDGKRSAQFEHTLLVTENGCEVLTERTPDSPPLWWM
eukprot:g5350.t1